MTLFGYRLREFEDCFFENLKKTKSAFPEETETIEFGLALMRDVSKIGQTVVSDYATEPDLLANHNLFARNRQLLLNAYICLLNSTYGTQFVILRVVLENNFLMRLFNKNPQSAFEWLSAETQKRFPKETQLKYGRSGISNRKIKVDLGKRIFGIIANEKVRGEISRVHSQLSDYIHPNFEGWQELVWRGVKKPIEVLLSMPRFAIDGAEKSIGLTMYLMQLSFKAFYETFELHLLPYDVDLHAWQASYGRLVTRYMV